MSGTSGHLRQFGRMRPGRSPRTGQALVEIGLTLGIFVVVVMLIFDTAWVLYHQVVVVQAAKRASRYAGTNRFNQAQITDFFFKSTPMSRITSNNPDVTIQVSTQAADATFTSESHPAGRPSVTVNVTYVHRLIAPFPGHLAQFTLSGAATSMISTWTARPANLVPSYTDVCPCP